MNYVFSTRHPRIYRFPTHTNYLVMDRAQAAASEVFIVELAPGQAPPPHRHDEMEQVFYILSGHGRLHIGQNQQPHPLNPGDVVRIPPATLHTVHCTGSTPLTYLAVDCFPHGHPPDEPTWDAHIKKVCRQAGWSFEQVTGRHAD